MLEASCRDANATSCGTPESIITEATSLLAKPSEIDIRIKPKIGR